MKPKELTFVQAHFRTKRGKGNKNIGQFITFLIVFSIGLGILGAIAIMFGMAVKALLDWVASGGWIIIVLALATMCIVYPYIYKKVNRKYRLGMFLATTILLVLVLSWLKGVIIKGFDTPLANIIAFDFILPVGIVVLLSLAILLPMWLKQRKYIKSREVNGWEHYKHFRDIPDWIISEAYQHRYDIGKDKIAGRHFYHKGTVWEYNVYFRDSDVGHICVFSRRKRG